MHMHMHIHIIHHGGEGVGLAGARAVQGPCASPQKYLSVIKQNDKANEPNDTANKTKEGPFSHLLGTPCGGEVLHICLKASRTKRPMQHRVAPHRPCRLFRTCLAQQTPDVTPCHT